MLGSYLSEKDDAAETSRLISETGRKAIEVVRRLPIGLLTLAPTRPVHIGKAKRGHWVDIDLMQKRTATIQSRLTCYAQS